MGGCLGNSAPPRDDYFESSDEEAGVSLLPSLLRTEKIADCIAGFLGHWEKLHVLAFELGPEFKISPETLQSIYNNQDFQEEWEDLMLGTIANMTRLHTHRSAFMHAVYCRYTVPWDDEEREFRSSFTTQVKQGLLQEFYWMMQDPERFRRRYEPNDSAYSLMRTLLIACGGQIRGPRMERVKHELTSEDYEKLVIPTKMFSKSFTFVVKDHMTAQFEDIPDTYVAQTPGLRSSLIGHAPLEQSSSLGSISVDERIALMRLSKTISFESEASPGPGGIDYTPDLAMARVPEDSIV